MAIRREQPLDLGSIAAATILTSLANKARQDQGNSYQQLASLLTGVNVPALQLRGGGGGGGGGGRMRLGTEPDSNDAVTAAYARRFADNVSPGAGEDLVQPPGSGRSSRRMPRSTPVPGSSRAQRMINQLADQEVQVGLDDSLSEDEKVYATRELRAKRQRLEAIAQQEEDRKAQLKSMELEAQQGQAQQERAVRVAKEARTDIETRRAGMAERAQNLMTQAEKEAMDIQKDMQKIETDKASGALTPEQAQPLLDQIRSRSQRAVAMKNLAMNLNNEARRQWSSQEVADRASEIMKDEDLVMNSLTGDQSGLPPRGPGVIYSGDPGSGVSYPGGMPAAAPQQPAMQALDVLKGMVQQRSQSAINIPKSPDGAFMVQTPAEARLLPSGSVFITPDGRRKRVP